jgi:hypothetical protein
MPEVNWDLRCCSGGLHGPKDSQREPSQRQHLRSLLNQVMQVSLGGTWRWSQRLPPPATIRPSTRVTKPTLVARLAPCPSCLGPERGDVDGGCRQVRLGRHGVRLLPRTACRRPHLPMSGSSSIRNLCGRNQPKTTPVSSFADLIGAHSLKLAAEASKISNHELPPHCYKKSFHRA